MNDEDIDLALMTGVDIPLPEFGLILHQPTVKEISMIGEHTFYVGAQCLTINKNMYIEDESLLSAMSNFQIFMTIMTNKDELGKEKKAAIRAVLSILFPNASVMTTPRSLLFKFEESSAMIDEENFEDLQKILSRVFCLQAAGEDNFNPANAAAKKIAEKLMRGRQRVAAQHASEAGSVLTQYVSALTVGLHSMSLQNLINLTIFQLYDLIERYNLYLNWDIDIRSRLAGAKGEKPVENWMKNIH